MIALRTTNPLRAFNTIYRPNHDRVHCPRTDLLETAENFLLKVDLPGFDKEDLDIQGTSEYIVIKAVRKDVENTENKESDQENDNNISVSRKIHFPVKISPGKAKISLKDGVLSIDMPKSEEAKAIKLYPA